MLDSPVSPTATRPTVAYIMSRFPKLTETFILYEMLAVADEGIRVLLYPLQREKVRVMHPEARPLVEQAHFAPWLAPRYLPAHLHYLRHHPRRYRDTLLTILRANWGSARFFAGALAFFPKALFWAAQMERAGVQHIHAHFASHPAMVAYVIHRLTGISFSFTAHGSDLHVDQHMLCEKVAAAARVITISEYNRELMLRHCGDRWRERIEVLHCGVDTTVFTGRAAPTSAGSPLTILAIGTLHEVKGQTVLIEACRRLHQQGIPLRCHLIGEGPDEVALRAQVAAAGLEEIVHFEGRRTREQIAAALQQADVLVAPSVPTRSGRREGIPVVLMEGMGSGLPVVASRLSGIPELVEEEQSGLLVPPGDAGALAAALARLSRDPALRARLGLAARARVQDAFDLRRNAARLAALFRTLVAA